jgi:nucleotide-binding universal stress UspA family protein
MFERVLLCYDGTTAGRKALRRGARLAVTHKSKVFVLSMCHPMPGASVISGLSGSVCLVDTVERDDESLQECLHFLEEQGLDAQGCLAQGNPIDVIADTARKLEADLIVLGHYPQPSGRRWWSGTERAALSERVDCCIFIAVNE